MAHVTVTINGRQYQVACDDGQEAHLSRLGKYVDNRVQELVAAVGQAGDARLLVMVSLLLSTNCPTPMRNWSRSAAKAKASPG